MLERTRELAQAASFSVLSVLLSDGRIGSYVMWVDVDGDHLVFATEPTSAKFAALRAHPQVTVTLLAPNPYSYVEVRGQVVDVELGAAADELIAKLGVKYNGKPYDRPTQWAVVRVEPRHERTW